MAVQTQVVSNQNMTEEERRRRLMQARQAQGTQQSTVGRTMRSADRQPLTGTIVQNPYTSAEAREAARGRFQEAMQPQIRRGVEGITSQLSPYMRGQRGSSLMREVYNPATQALAGFETGMEEKGMDFAATAPYQEAAMTGKLGGIETLAGKGLGLQEAALFGEGAGGRQTLTGKQFGLEEKEQEDLELIARRMGYPSAAAMILAQSTGATPEEAYGAGFRTTRSIMPYGSVRPGEAGLYL